jgi:hypothetical protein
MNVPDLFESGMVMEHREAVRNARHDTGQAGVHDDGRPRNDRMSGPECHRSGHIEAFHRTWPTCKCDAVARAREWRQDVRPDIQPSPVILIGVLACG